MLLPGQAPEKVVVVVPPEPENVEIVDKDAGVARLHDVVAGHEFDAGVARERVFGVRDDDELLPGILPHALRQLFVRGIEMIQNEFFRSRAVEELPAALDRYGQFVGVFRAVGRRIGYGVEPDQDRRVRPDFRLVGRQRLAPCPRSVAQPDVAVFAVTVGRALLFGGGRFPPFVFLFGGPAGDRRFSAGFQRVGRAVFQPVEIAFDAGRESLYDRNEIVQVFDLGVQRDAAFSFLIGAGCGAALQSRREMPGR